MVDDTPKDAYLTVKMTLDDAKAMLVALRMKFDRGEITRETFMEAREPLRKLIEQLY